MADSAAPVDPRVDLEALEGAVTRRLESWSREGFVQRFWRKDPSLWPAAPPAEVGARMGWLDLPTAMKERVAPLTEFADEVREDAFERVVVLGMGGSSLAPDVLSRSFGHARGHPGLHVLDSTHPDAVRRAVADCEIERILFVVSSKSGTTLEPNSFFAYFWKEVSKASDDPGQQFCAITDEDTPLDTLAAEKGFRQCFRARSDVGGRYSALTEFGLVPAALLGVPIGRLLERAERMAVHCAPEGEISKNPGFKLGAELGELALAGRDKVTFLASPTIGAFPAWAEQLIAESTGKAGKGIVPVAGEVDPFGSLDAHDGVFAYLTLRGEEDEKVDDALAKAEGTGTPGLVCELADRLDLGREFLRWEIAIAAAGAVIGIDPFDQPDVELAKELARQAMAPSAGGAQIASPQRVRADDPEGLGKAIRPWMASARPDDYLVVQAFLDPNPTVDAALGGIRRALRARLRLSTTLGYGPRFLHSTGQLHKGGPNSGLFLQLVGEVREDLTVPPGPTSFGRILRAQADGDALALQRKGRRIAGVELGTDVGAGLAAIEAIVNS